MSRSIASTEHPPRVNRMASEGWNRDSRLTEDGRRSMQAIEPATDLENRLRLVSNEIRADHYVRMTLAILVAACLVLAAIVWTKLLF